MEMAKREEMLSMIFADFFYSLLCDLLPIESPLLFIMQKKVTSLHPDTTKFIDGSFAQPLQN